MPDKKIINIDVARRAHQVAKPTLIALLNQLDELENTLETLDEYGITTREELVALMQALEEKVDDTRD